MSSSAPSAIPHTQRHPSHPSPIFASKINQVNNENVARAVYYISPFGSLQNMPPPCPTPSSAPINIPHTQRHPSHPSPIFASKINQVNNVNVARAVYYISPLGSSQNMPPLAQRHPPHPSTSPAPNTNSYTHHQSSHPISTKSIM